MTGPELSVIADVLADHCDTFRRPEWVDCSCNTWSMPFDHLGITEVADQHRLHVAEEILRAVRDGQDLIFVDAAEPEFGAQVGMSLLRTHGPAVCRGPLDDTGKPICCIHNPSDHHMRTWRQNWRGDKGVMERLCSHGIGHPDPGRPGGAHDELGRRPRL